MIIKVKQTASNIKQSYDIDCSGVYYHGEMGKISRLQDIVMSDKSETVIGKYKMSALRNYIPFRWLFGAANLTRVFFIYQNDEEIGSFVHSHHGVAKSFYVLALASGTILHCYIVGKGSFRYCCVYNGDEQIALIETYLNVDDYKYIHKVYLLDDYKGLATVLSFFVLYYSNYHFSKRFHMSSGSVYEKSLTLSKYNDKFDPSWRETNFPYENFFGKINLFKQDI